VVPILDIQAYCNGDWTNKSITVSMPNNTAPYRPITVTSQRGIVPGFKGSGDGEIIFLLKRMVSWSMYHAVCTAKFIILTEY
jgi:hypothetical protein